MNEHPGLPPGINPPPASHGISPLPQYNETSKAMQEKDIPVLYQKTIPYLTAVISGFTQVAHKFVKPVFDALVDWLSDLLQNRLYLTWDEIFSELKVKRGASQAIIDDVKEKYDAGAWYILFYYYLLWILLTLGRFAGSLQLIRASAIQESNSENPINLTSPEQVLIAQLRGDISPLKAEELLGRLGIAKDVTTTIASALKQYASPDTIIAALIRREISGDEADRLLDKLNVAVEARKAIVGAMKNIAPDEVLIQNVYRGRIDKNTLNKELSRRGLDEDQQQYYLNILDRIPPIQDIITMAVREAFSEEKSKRFQHDEDFPPDFGTWAEKQGFSRDWAKKYWRAHWQLPSPQMVFEMLHRGAVDNADVDQYLIMADYPAFWRDRLKKISYTPLTRVDVRRMYELGTFKRAGGLSETEAVKKAYKDLGYDDNNADLMVQFTVDMYGEERKKLTEAKVINLYKKGLINRSETFLLLKKLKYRDEYIELIMANADFDIDSDVLDSLMKKLRSLYITGEYTKSMVLAELGVEANIPIDTTALFKSWDFEKASRRRLPTAFDVKKWVELGIVTPVQGASKLMLLGYSKDDANAYIKEITGDY